jgi:hypothetical protein
MTNVMTVGEAVLLQAQAEVYEASATFLLAIEQAGTSAEAQDVACRLQFLITRLLDLQDHALVVGDRLCGRRAS